MLYVAVDGNRFYLRRRALVVCRYSSDCQTCERIIPEDLRRYVWFLLRFRNGILGFLIVLPHCRQRDRRFDFAKLKSIPLSNHVHCPEIGLRFLDVVGYLHIKVEDLGFDSPRN